ncbi:MAG: hypothetical protein ACJASX_000907 [Limisphaerales bacterium]|jgi:hypothetical protein
MNRLRIFSFLLTGVLSASVLHAQLPVANLSTLYPAGGKVGSTVAITLGGTSLEGLREVLFSHQGISGKLHADGKKFVVTIGKDVPAGIHRAQVIGQYGVSNPRAFQVTRLNDVIGTAGISSFEKAMTVPVNSIVNGQTDKEANDIYKVAVKKGQRVLVQLLDRQIDSQLAGVATLFDSAQREVGRITNEQIGDHTATADGDLYVQVSDRVYRGGSTYYYRLKVSSAPQVDYVLPLAVKPGAKSKIKIFGRNLGGAKTTATIDRTPVEMKEIEVTAPPASQALPTGISLAARQATLDGFNHEGHLIGFATDPVIVDTEPNDSPEKAQAIKLPCDLSGQFYPARDRDYYSFDAKKGEVYQAEMISHRLGLPTDPLAVIQKADQGKDGKWTYADVFTLSDGDKNFGGPDFNTFHHDDEGRFEVKADGSYRVVVRDLFNGVASDPRRVYRLIFRKAQPDYQLVVQPISRKAKTDKRDVWRSNTLLRQGDVEVLNVLLFRRDGYREEINIEIEGLPAGVSFSPLKLAGTLKSGLLMVRADETAKAWAGPVRIVGKSKSAGKDLIRNARIATVNWDIDYSTSTTETAHVRLTDRLVLGVTDEPAPIELIANAGKPLEVEVGGKVKVPVKVARRGAFAADLKVKPYGHAALAKIKDATIKKDSGSLEINLATYKLPAGTHQLYLKTNSKGKYTRRSKELIAAEAAAKVAEAAALPAEKHAQALADVMKIKGLTPEQIAAVKKEADEAAKVAKDLVTKRDAAKKKAKDLAAKVKAKDLTVDFYSMPFLVKVNPKAKAKK